MKRIRGNVTWVGKNVTVEGGVQPKCGRGLENPSPTNARVRPGCVQRVRNRPKAGEVMASRKRQEDSEADISPPQSGTPNREEVGDTADTKTRGETTKSPRPGAQTDLVEHRNEKGNTGRRAQQPGNTFRTPDPKAGPHGQQGKIRRLHTETKSNSQGKGEEDTQAQ